MVDEWNTMGCMATLTNTGKCVAGGEDLAGLRELLVEEQRRLEGLMRRVDRALSRQRPEPAKDAPQARASPLDLMKNVMGAARDLRAPNGNLSAERVARLYGISLSQLAGWLGRTRQGLSKTPDADSLQNSLGYFERVARLRLMAENDAEFRKWLRMPNHTFGNRTPLDLMKAGLWQELADKVDDMLTGMPT